MTGVPLFRVSAGDPAFYFKQRTPTRSSFAFDTVAGRYLVLGFLGSAGDPCAQSALQSALARTDIFNDTHAALFAVSNDPSDETLGRLTNRIPGFRVFWDFNMLVAKIYGAIPTDAAIFDKSICHRGWVIIDPTLRVIDTIPLDETGEGTRQMLDLITRLPPPSHFSGQELQAPILLLPKVFEPGLCKQLIGLYEQHGGEETGVMRDIGGRTVGVNDIRQKSRKDYTITDTNLIKAIGLRISRRVAPEIAKVHQFHATRMERYIVSCYAAENNGHFAGHRDNTTAGTAHRRFAVSINLNSDFDGGEVGFPEYGPRTFKAPPGGAVVFSCSLLHKVSRVTRGRRYAFLPFLYDDAAASIRRENARFLGDQHCGAGQST